MFHIKNLEKFANENPGVVSEEVLTKARTLTKPWKGALLTGDVQILLGAETSKKFFDAFDSSKEHQEICHTEIIKVQEKCPRIFERLQKTAKKVDEVEMALFVPSGCCGGGDQIVPSGERRASFSLLAAQAEKH